MAGGAVETDPEKLARHCRFFAAGAKKLYDEKGDGDMWLFELYHHLSDCATQLERVSGTQGEAK